MRRLTAIILIAALLCIGVLTGCSGAQTSASDAVQSHETSGNTQAYSYESPEDDFYAEDDDDYGDTMYVLNTNTKKFHYSYCSSVDEMKEKNKKYVTWSREEIIDKGYKPCKRCEP